VCAKVVSCCWWKATCFKEGAPAAARGSSVLCAGVSISMDWGSWAEGLVVLLGGSESACVAGGVGVDLKGGKSAVFATGVGCAPGGLRCVVQAGV
jgi:hypothetical protein